MKLSMIINPIDDQPKASHPQQTKGVMTMKKLTYSAISYVAAALLLSGSVFANPADVSGDSKPIAERLSANSKPSFYLALNRYPVALPPMTQHKSHSFSVTNNSEAYIDSLQKELRDQLDILIETKESFSY